MAKAKRTMQRCWQMCWRTRAEREGAVAAGNPTAGRMRHAFEDTGDGRGVKREGDNNGSAREGELADVRQRCQKRHCNSQ